MPITKNPKTGKVTHHSYDPKDQGYNEALKKGEVAVANPHTKTRKNSQTKRSYT
jgi:hypothetical protein